MLLLEPAVPAGDKSLSGDTRRDGVHKREFNGQRQGTDSDGGRGLVILHKCRGDICP